MSAATRKYLLSEDQIPKAWYNLVADLPTPPAPVLNPGTGQPIGPADLGGRRRCFVHVAWRRRSIHPPRSSTSMKA
jgi:hypothetical protein